ncbi:MAG TPA: glutamine synthetase family protein [Thermomicrobiales bacterium]|nr:glutamine synthetase family protein [Thermomicrobiales bacterium]
MTSVSARGRLTVDELIARVRSGAIDTVITAICDMQGRLVGKRVTGEFFIDHALEHGTHFCTYLLGTDMEMETPDGYAAMDWASGYGDYLARPDWGTLRVIPWLEKTALVLCDAVDETTGATIDFAPRAILKRQIERLAAHGLAPMMATELEFYVLKESYDEARAKQFVGLTPFGWYNEDYQLLQASKAEPLYRRLRNEMTAAGIPIEFSKGEAAPGQHEINIHYADALESADRAALFKHGAKEIAYQAGNAVTFMSKPHHEWTGSSGHVHVSLVDADSGKNVFATESGEMSETMRWFLGGLTAGARDLSILLASTVNAYKRFALASWAPVHLVWGRDNRTCAFRVVGRGSGLRIENRLPGADANPYLSFAAVLAAGLDGIERQLDPGEEFRGNGYTATDLPRIPKTLYRAIDAWEASDLARRAFGEDVHAHYLNMATVEQEAYDRVVTDWERERYLERG